MTTLDEAARQRVAAFADVFHRADGRMAGLPLYHSVLAVEARGFRPLDAAMLIGTLITPWCMNLVLLPAPDATWASHPQGTEIEHDLPCGRIRFVTAKDENAGDYRMCSLFSPVFQFEDMAAARATADAALAEVMAPRAAPADERAAGDEADGTGDRKRLQAVSRRDLFRRFGT